MDIFKRHPIVCFSSSDWWTFHPQAFERKMIAFSKYTKVLFINTVNPSMPSGILTYNFWMKVKKKLPSLLRGFRKPMDNVYVLTPVILPFKANPNLQKLNAILLVLQLKILFLFLRIRSPIFWVGNLGAVNILLKFKYEYLIYDCTDKFDASRYITEDDKAVLKVYDQTLIEKADAILCVSHELHKHYHALGGEKVHYFPHGVDTNHFSPLPDNDELVPQDLIGIPHPIIGYHGSLTNANNLELLEYCVEKRPEWSFVLIGRIGSRIYKDLEKYPNLYFLGSKKYEELPRYIDKYDVGIMFWKLSDWIHFSNPLKTKEFLAMGKPVVSVPIPEIVQQFSGIISIGDTKESFLTAIDQELNSYNEDKRFHRIKSVENDSWEKYIEKCAKIVLSLSEKI